MSYGVSFEEILLQKQKHHEKGKRVTRQKPAPLEIKIPLGARVKYQHSLSRQRSWYDSPKSNRREWVPNQFDRGGEGIVCGLRLLQNGQYVSHYEEWPYLAVEDYQWAYMVAFDLRQKPIFVRPEDLEVIDEA